MALVNHLIPPLRLHPLLRLLRYTQRIFCLVCHGDLTNMMPMMLNCDGEPVHFEISTILERLVADNYLAFSASISQRSVLDRSAS